MIIRVTIVFIPNDPNLKVHQCRARRLVRSAVIESNNIARPSLAWNCARLLWMV